MSCPVVCVLPMLARDAGGGGHPNGEAGERLEEGCESRRAPERAN